ncbi:hypothetical protein BJY01DRAFT_244920 [Aspergillus pseudoustus]|uniref:Uncharacterized protein n=1 Tax=Aspergillus pseudoustus TaxID=1810923 RepID=A0ABR4KH29_9EURO
MSPKEGNAFAQIKAKEQQHRQSEDSNQGKYSTSPLLMSSRDRPSKANATQGPASKPINTCKNPGLHYDAELALPMPKPLHVRPERTPSPTSKTSIFTKPNVTKKRSTTEPTLPTEASLKGEASEKKKSKVATLRSKFSLKDLGKEFRREKDIPPLSSMPKLGGKSSTEAKRPSSDGNSHRLPNQNFDEAKLYVPKIRKDDVHPNSAPPHMSNFHESATMDKPSHDSIWSCPSMRTPTKSIDDGKSEREFQHSFFHSNDFGQAVNPSFETLLRDGSSPAALAGECKNSGQPEVIQVGSRVPSLKAENVDSTVPSTPKTPPPQPAPIVDPVTYSPSIYDTPKTVASKVTPSLPKKKERPKISHPLIVSSSSYKGKVLEEQLDDQLFMAPRAPPLPPALPHKARAREVQRTTHNHIPMNDSNFFGVTSHGGCAPPPPHPGYQNTVTLEQQLAAHVDSLHYHVNTAVQKLSKTFENSNNWTADQILRQVETMTDVARTINFRTVTQAEIVKDLPRLMVDVVRQETRQLEDRMKAFVQQEMAKLKGELDELIVSNVRAATSQAQDVKSPRAETPYQGAQGWAKPPRDNKQGQYQNKGKSRQIPMKREDLAFNKADLKKAEPKQESMPVSAPQADALSVEQDLTDNASTPTAAFRIPNPLNNGSTPAPSMQTVIKHPGEELSGSPELKAANLKISGPLPAAEANQIVEKIRATAPQRESDTKSQSAISSEYLKTPKKKGMFSSFRRHNGDNNYGTRFLRTPRRAKDGHSAIEKKAFAPANSASFTMSALNSAIGSQIHREDSPSLVHPALRNPHQKQIMLDRERHFAQMERQLQSHAHPLRASHSHHNFDTKVSRSNSPPLPLPPSFVPYDPSAARYAAGMSVATSTSSSFHDPRAYQGNMNYPHSASTPQLSSSSLPPHDQGQLQPHPQHFFGSHSASAYGCGPSPLPHHFDGVEWNGNDDSNGPILNEAGYPINNFF